MVRELYALAGEALQAERSVWGGLSRHSPQRALSTALQKMELLGERLVAHAADGLYQT